MTESEMYLIAARVTMITLFGFLIGVLITMLIYSLLKR